MIGVIRSDGWWRFACGDVYILILYFTFLHFIFPKPATALERTPNDTLLLLPTFSFYIFHFPFLHFPLLNFTFPILLFLYYISNWARHCCGAHTQRHTATPTRIFKFPKPKYISPWTGIHSTWNWNTFYPIRLQQGFSDVFTNDELVFETYIAKGNVPTFD